MSDLRKRLAEVLAMPTDTVAQVFDAATALAVFCKQPALARALEDAERYRWLRKRIAPREVTEGYARMSAANADPDISSATDAAVDAARNRHD